MTVNWRTVLIALAVLAAVVGICAVNLRCSGKPETGSTVARVCDELSAGKEAYRNMRADELAALARDMRVLAKRYVEQGDKKKAQRAIGAAQELDKKIAELMRSNDGQVR